MIKVISYIAGGFLIFYGGRSLIAGIRNEAKSYWLALSFSKGLKDLLKDKYDRFCNLFYGGLSLIAGCIILFILLKQAIF
jgi:hypothetical protein